MTRTKIVCPNCQRSWNVDLHDSLYLQLDLLSRPCPQCEHCTLCRSDPETPRVAGRFRKVWRRAPGGAGALSGQP